MNFMIFFDILMITMKQTFFISLLTLLTILPLSTKVWAQEYEEVSYDELIQRLSKKKSRVIHDQVGASVLDDIMIHIGAGLTTSSIQYSSGSLSSTRQVNGFQLSFGIDLFSQNWASEMLVRNLSGNDSSEIKSYREFDLRVLYREKSTTTTPGYRLGAGLGNRYLRVEEPSFRFEEYSPLFVFFGGLELTLNKNFSLGAELGYRTSIITDIHDKESFDFLLRMDTYF